MSARLAAFALAASLLTLAPAAALAQEQPAENAALATELFNAGRDLMAANNFVAACPKLAESARLDAKVGTLARLAECEEKLNHLVVARGRWQQALNLAKTSNDSRLPKVVSELERIDKIVPKLNLTLVGAPPPDLSIKVDVLQVNAASLGVPIPVEPGKHTITVSAPGRQTFTRGVETAADGATTEVQIPELAPGAAPPPDPAAAAPPPATSAAAEKTAPSSGGGLRTVGLITAGVGGVVTLVGLGMGIQAKISSDDSNQPGGCIANDCTAEGARIRGEARDWGDRATIATVVGLVIAGGGLAMFFLAPSSSASGKAPAATRTARLRLSPDVGPTSGSLQLRGTW